MSAEPLMNIPVEQQHDRHFTLKLKDHLLMKFMAILILYNLGTDYEPPTPEIGKDVKTLRRTAFILYILSILLFILLKITVTRYPNFMQRRTVGAISDHLFFLGFCLYQKLLFQYYHIRIIKEVYGVSALTLHIIDIIFTLIIYLPNFIYFT
jgi:hypothetical protein